MKTGRGRPSPVSPSQGSGAAAGRCAGEQNRRRSSRRGGSRAAAGRWGAGPPPTKGLGRLLELAMKRSGFYLRPGERWNFVRAFCRAQFAGDRDKQCAN
jgi:hypothetical protein